MQDKKKVGFTCHSMYLTKSHTFLIKNYHKGISLSSNELQPSSLNMLEMFSQGENRLFVLFFVSFQFYLCSVL